MIKTSIEGWAEENNINLTEKQIQELVDGLNICFDMGIGSRGFTLGGSSKSENENQTKSLKLKLKTLEKFINSKGFNISYGENYVTEHFMTQITNNHKALDEQTTYY